MVSTRHRVYETIKTEEKDNISELLRPKNDDTNNDAVMDTDEDISNEDLTKTTSSEMKTLIVKISPPAQKTVYKSRRKRKKSITANKRCHQ